MARVLHLETALMMRALEALVAADLIAWNGRVVQVLPLPDCAQQPHADEHPADQAGKASRHSSPSTSEDQQQEELVDVGATSALEPEARAQLGRFLGNRQPSTAVVQAVAKGLALKTLRRERAGQQATGHGKGRCGS